MNMTVPPIGIAGNAERYRAFQLITLGFSADPVARWIWPDAEAYLDAMPKFTAAFAGQAIDHGTAFFAGDFNAAALWLPPEIEPDAETIGALLEATVAPETLEEAAGFFGQMAEYHPHEPCWYLPVIAADPSHQGRGLGSALMKHALRRCDEDGLPAYLESSNPRNISLYERHGFELMGTIQVGSSPVMHPMIRHPRR